MGCLLVLLLVIQGAQSQPLPSSNQFDPNNCLSQTADNRPQWDDVGLHDILFAIGQPTVPAPNYVRLPYDYAPPTHCSIPRHYMALLSCGERVPPRHEPKGSLYLWHFLRL